jgi:hypothetical protein
MGYYQKIGIRFIGRVGIFLFSPASEVHPAQWVNVSFFGCKEVEP